MNNASTQDIFYMQQALRLARYGFGQVAPNPSVGCVIVDAQNNVVGTGWTQKGGRPHAEAMALEEAGARSVGGTAYVTLEPCAHYGETPPCAQALIDAKIARVVYALKDPDPRVSGKGVAMLQTANIKVESGCEKEVAEIFNRGFLTRIKQNRVSLTLKLAVSENGFMRTPKGEAIWITDKLARHYGHLLRAEHEAIITGRGTIEHDDPELTCRLSGMEDCSPQPIIMSRNFRLAKYKLKSRAQITAISPDEVLHELAQQGYNSALLESGAELARAFMGAGLVDSVALFRAPHRVEVAPLHKSNTDLEYIGWREDDYLCKESHMFGKDHYSFWIRKCSQVS